MTGAPLAGGARRGAARSSTRRERPSRRSASSRSTATSGSSRRPTDDARQLDARARGRRRSSATARASTTRSTRSLALLARARLVGRLDRAALGRRRHRQPRRASTARSQGPRAQHVRDLHRRAPLGRVRLDRAAEARARDRRHVRRGVARADELAAIYDALGRRLASEYVVRYRSDAHRRSRRSTSRSGSTALGTATTSYVAPTPAGLAPYHRSLVVAVRARRRLSPFVLAPSVAGARGTGAARFARPDAEHARRARRRLRRRQCPTRRRRRRLAARRAGAERALAGHGAPPHARARSWRSHESTMSATAVVLLTLVATRARGASSSGLIAPIFALLGLLTPLVTTWLGRQRKLRRSATSSPTSCRRTSRCSRRRSAPATASSAH